MPYFGQEWRNGLLRRSSLSSGDLWSGERRRRHSVTRCDILHMAEKGIKLFTGVLYITITVYHCSCSLGSILQRRLSHHLELVPTGKQADHLVALPAPLTEQIVQLRERGGGEEVTKMALPNPALVDTYPLTKLRQFHFFHHHLTTFTFIQLWTNSSKSKIVPINTVE